MLFCLDFPTAMLRHTDTGYLIIAAFSLISGAGSGRLVCCVVPCIALSLEILEIEKKTDRGVDWT